MDVKDTFLRIAQNEENVGKCDSDTAANIINNEESLDKPATYFMTEPQETNPNGSIAVNQTRRMLESGSYDGAGATLADAKLYAFYKPIQNELFQKEQEYKKLVFDNSGFFTQFMSDLGRNWNSLKRSKAIYNMAKAQEDGDVTSALEYKYQIEDLDKKIAGYVQPEDGIINSSANLVASVGRNAPELAAVGIGAGLVTYFTGGTGTAAFLATAGSTVLNGTIIYKDTFDLEAGDILESMKDKNIPLEEKIKIAEDYANISALIESSSALFGLTKLGSKAIYKGALSLTEEGAARFAKKTIEQGVERVAKKKMIDELLKKSIVEKIKDPKYLAYIGKRTGEHVLAATGEGAQEVTQSIFQDAFLRAVDDGEKAENVDIIKNIFKVLGDGTESSKYASLFLNTFAASMLVSGTGATATTGAKTAYQKLLARSMMSMNSEQVAENIMKQKESSQAYQKSPTAYSANTSHIIESGNAPQEVAINAAPLAEIIDEAQKEGNTTILEQLQKLGVTKDSVEKSVAGTGIVKLDFAKFDEVVLDPSNPELFQKVKGQYTFDETTLTNKEMETIINGFIEKRPELSSAVMDPKSVFNKVMTGLSNNKNFTPRQVIHNAVAAQLSANRASTFEGEEVDSSKIQFDILNQSQQMIGKTKGLFNKVKDKVLYSFGGKRSLTAALDDLNTAELMEQRGESMADIYKKTRWFIDPKDNMWKYEISDKDATINEELLDDMMNNKVGEQLLKDVLKHDALYAAYPQFGNLPVKYNSHLRTTSGRFMGNSRGDSWIEVKKTEDLNELKLTILHELQHSIQGKEGFARGGTSDGRKTNIPENLRHTYFERVALHNELWKILQNNDIRSNVSGPSHLAIQDARGILNKLAEKDKSLQEKLKKLDEYDARLKRYDESGSFFRYLNIPGENEARDVEASASLTDEQRMKVLPANLAGTRAPIAHFSIGGEQLDAPIQVQTTSTDRQIAGMFSDEMGQYIIRLTEAANPTTFMHEFNHLIITDMLKSFNSGKMTEYWKKQTLKIADFVGAKVVNGQLNFTEEQYEKVAEAWTTYLKEGKTPIEGLRDFFNRMSEWFIDIYKKLVMAKVPLNKSIRSAFDSLLVSEEELNQAVIDKNLRAIGRRTWISESDYQQYLSDLSALNRVSTNKHIEAIRKKARTALEKQNQQKLAEIMADVTAQLSNDPRYSFVDDVRARKINRADIPSNYKLKNPSAYTVENGIPLQQFITDHSDVVQNVADVVELLNNIEPKQDVVERESQSQFNNWLNEKYPELSDVDAKLAAANIELIKVRVKEYMMLNKIPMNQFNQYYNELVKAGDQEVSTMKIRELTNLDRLQDLETRIVTKQRFAKNDSELANALWHQAALDYIIMRAKDIKVQVNKFNKKFDKYRYLPSESFLKHIDSYDFDMITAIMHNIGFTKKRPRVKDIPLSDRLNAWVARMEGSAFSDAGEIRDYIPTLSQETGVKFENNTYHDFAIFDVLSRLIESISRSEKELTEVNKQKLREEDVKSVVEFQVKKGIDLKGRIKSWWTDNVVMKEQFLKKIFPTKIFTEYVLPFVDSMTKREQRIARNDELLYNELKNTINRRKEVMSVSLASGPVLNMTYEEMQVAVFNIDNMETWLMSWNAEKGQNLNEDDFMSIIEQAPQQMIEDAQKVWEIFDSQKAEFREAQYKTNGFLMDYVEPRSITLSDGRTIQSGYFPRGKVPKSQADFNNLVSSFSNDGIYTIGTSKFAKDRVSQAHNGLDLSINSLRSWLYHSATVIEVGPNFNKLEKMLNDPIMVAQMGKDLNRSLNDWMSYSIVGDRLNKLYSTLDKISSVQILGWEPIRIIIQMLGFVPALSEVGVQWVAPQFLNIHNWLSLANVNEAAKLSPYMKERYENALNHLASVSENNMIIRQGKTLGEKVMNIAMAFTVHGDAFSSALVWNAAYNKYISQGKTQDEAVLLADSAVRTSQGDTTTVSRPKILQGDKKVITKFASYFLAINSRISSAIIGRDRIELVATLMLAGIVSPVLESYFRSLCEWAIGSDDDKKKWRKNKISTFEELFFYNAKTNIASTIGQSLVPVAGAGGYAGNLLSTGNVYDKPLPMLDYLYSVIKTGGYPILAATAETEKDRRKYMKAFKKSALKSLTTPNKVVKLLTE